MPGSGGREREECRRGGAGGWCDPVCAGDGSGEEEGDGVTMIGVSTVGKGSVVGERRDCDSSAVAPLTPEEDRVMAALLLLILAW